MKSNASSPAHPCADEYKKHNGLTKREYAAIHIYAGLISATDNEGELTATNCADIAINEADKLLKYLEEN